MTDEDDVAPYLVRRATGAVAGSACPEANLLVGFAEGALAPDESERVAAHAADCPECREALDEVEAAALAPDAPAERRPAVLRWPVLAAAAALLVAVGAAVLLPRERAEEPPADTASRLVAAARRLARERPALFGDFVPLDDPDPEGRPPTGDGRERGGVRLLAPSDVVLSTRPDLVWAAVAGARRYDVSLEADDGRRLWTRPATGTVLPYPEAVPDLARGTRYGWSVAFEGVLGGTTEGRRRFRVASSEEAASFEEATRLVADQVDADLRDLLLARWALRRGLVEEAERHARAHLARSPSDVAGRGTLRRVLLVQGSREAAAYEDPGAGSR